MKLTLQKRQAITADIETFWFKPEYPLSYIAGQYVEVTLPHANPDQRGSKHWFTLSSSPTESLLAITTRLGKSSFKQALWQLQAGATLTCTEPLGDFVLPKDTSLPLIFIVGGIGITPLRSMIKWLLDTHEQRHIDIIYSVHHLADVAFSDLLSTYTLNLKTVTTRLTTQSVLQHIGKLTNQLIYISGPDPMVDNIYDGLLAYGVPRSQVVRDGFPGYSA